MEIFPSHNHCLSNMNNNCSRDSSLSLPSLDYDSFRGGTIFCDVESLHDYKRPEGGD
jgi:hypothetical protein